MSEYIPRLREQLVAAAAREHAGQRRRVAVRPWRAGLVLAAAAIAAAVVLAIGAIDLARDEQPVATLPSGSSLAYRVTPAPGGDAAAAAERSAAVLRARIAAARIAGATVTVAGDRIGIRAGGADLAAIAALAVPGKLAIYDWEASVLGPDGRPAPGDDRVTGGANVGDAGAVSRYEAVLRAAKAQSAGGASAYWLVDDKAREVLGGPQPSRAALLEGAPAAPSRSRVLEAPRGVRVTRAPGGWFALDDGAAVSNADIATAIAMRDPATREPIVALELTPQGQAAFSVLTREVARRGRAGYLPGEDPMLASQHLAIVLDDDIASLPFIDFQQVPDGIDGADGVQIQGGLTMARAKQIAIMLGTGPMPATLTEADR